MTRWFYVSVLALLVSICIAMVGRADQQTDDTPRADALHLRTGKVVLESSRSLHVSAEQLHAGHYVVQLNGPMTPERRAALKDAGIELGQYVPMNAYMVNLPEGFKLKENTRDLNFVRSVVAYDKSWKLDPEIGGGSYQTPERINLARDGKLKLVVKLFQGTDVQAASNAIRAIGGVQISDIQPRTDGGLIELTIPSASYQQLADNPAVEYVQDSPEITERNDTNKWILQSNVLNSTPIWDHGITGVGQIGGHIDNTLNPSHCAFNDTSGNPIGPTHRKIVAYNGVQGYSAHGNFTGGIFVGDAVPAGGTAQYRGMAYGARMVCTRLNTVTSANTLSIFNTAHSQGARVHTNSWGTDFTQVYNQQVRDIDDYSYNNEDGLVLFAATNQNSVIYTPENAKNCVAVCGTQDTPSQESWCVGGHAPTLDGRRKPDVMAPACGTISSLGSGTVCTFGTNGTGTSYACPAAAGAAILIREYYMDGFYPSGAANGADAFTPSGALIKSTLINSSANMTGVAGYPSDTEGWGRVLLDNALYFTGEPRKLIVDDVRNANGLTTGQSKSYNIQVNSNAVPLKISLVWTDPPAAVSSNPNYINDLNLVVTDPSNNTYLGNVFDVSEQSATGGAADFKNNVEVVLRNTPATGTYTVQVNANAVNVGVQGFAVVMTGDISSVVPLAGPDCDQSGTFDLDRDTACFVDVLLEVNTNLASKSAVDMNNDTLNNGDDIQGYINCVVNGTGCP